MNRCESAGLTARAPLLASAMQLNAAPPARSMLVLPDGAQVYDIGHGEARILVDAGRSNGAWWLGSFVSDPGRKTSLHVHFSADEQFYVLEGVLSVWLDDHWQDLPSGAVAAVPRRVPHALGNRTAQPVRFLSSGNPAGFERFFSDIQALSRRLPYGAPEFLLGLKKLYPKYDSELLGPPPEG